MPRTRRLTDINLNTVPFQGAVFTPIDYTPIAPDYNIMQRSFAIQEGREKEAAEKQTAIDAALADVERNLVNTPEMNQWFSDYKQGVKDRINNAASVGDYASAINIATREAGNMTSDSAVIGRLEASKNYKAWLDDLDKKADSGYINKDTKEYFKKKNPFVYQDGFDSNGNVVKGDTYENLQKPVKDIKLDEFIGQAFKYCIPRKPESGNYKTTDNTGVTKSSTLEYVDEDSIINNLNEIFSLQDDARAALWQRYEVQRDKYKELKDYVINHPEDKDANQLLEQQKDVMSKNDGIVDFEHFVARTLGKSAITNNLAYRYKTHSDNNQTTEQRYAAGRRGQLAAESPEGNTPETPGGASASDSKPDKTTRAVR